MFEMENVGKEFRLVLLPEKRKVIQIILNTHVVSKVMVLLY